MLLHFSSIITISIGLSNNIIIVWLCIFFSSLIYSQLYLCGVEKRLERVAGIHAVALVLSRIIGSFVYKHLHSSE